MKRTHATRPCSRYGYRGPANCWMDRVILLMRRMTLRSVDVTLPLTIRLITIRALGEPGTYDARASICTGISSKLHCSAVSLELDAAGVNSSLLPRIPHTGAPHYPYTTYPPTTATSYSSSTSLNILQQTFVTFRLLRLNHSNQSYLLHAISRTDRMICHSVVLLLAILLPYCYTPSGW